MPFATVPWNVFFTSKLRPAFHVTCIITMLGGYENVEIPFFRTDAAFSPDGAASCV
jgi:hypothetical protein